MSSVASKSLIVLAAVLLIAVGAHAMEQEVRFSRALLKKVVNCPQRSCCDGCSDCRCGVCKGCGGGWYWKDDWCYEVEPCKACPDHCDDCDCSGHCNSCSDGYYWEGSYCKYHGKSSASADAGADCYGWGCSTHTVTDAQAGPGYASSHSHSSANSG